MLCYRLSKEIRLFLLFNRKGLLQFERTQLTGGMHLSSYLFFLFFQPLEKVKINAFALEGAGSKRHIAPLLIKKRNRKSR